MKINSIEEKEILDFEEEIKVELVVNERNDALVSDMNLPRYYASFKNAESKEGSCLVGCSGNGNSIDDAIQDYCKRVSCRTMVFDAYSDNRSTIVFPRLIHTKLLNK